MAPKTITHDELLARELATDPEFRAEWERLAPAREFAIALTRFRAENQLSQRGLAARLGVSQPRVAKMESGEHNPDIESMVRAARVLGIEFCINIVPAGKRAKLTTKRAHRGRSTADHGVSIIAASA